MWYSVMKWCGVAFLGEMYVVECVRYISSFDCGIISLVGVGKFVCLCVPMDLPCSVSFVHK